MMGMTKLRERFKETMQAEAKKLDAKRTRKALKRVLPHVEWIYTKARGPFETKLLLSAGWEPVSQSGGDLMDKILGSQTTVTTLLRKRNPNL